jgi:AAHS family 4-hydroxybenzoate transporter-like MFS transporter
MLFRGALARITPVMWIAYMCSSALVFYLAFWGPIINERLGFSVSAAANIAASASVAGCVGQLVIARFIDRRGAGTTGVMPLLAVPTLLVIGLVSLQPALFVAILMFANIVVIGGHGGMHSIAAIFYRPAIRANGAAWATSIAKFGAMLGPWLAGVLLTAHVSAQGTFFVFALFPVLMAVLLFVLGFAQRRLPADADGALTTAAEPEVSRT